MCSGIYLLCFLGVFGSPPPPGAPPSCAPTSSDSSPDARTPKLRLGHSSSGDGTLGFVFDRRGEPKLRVDGTPEVIVLRARVASSSVTAFIDDDERTWAEGDAWGRVRFLAPGRDPVLVTRDADAAPLPDAPQPAIASRLHLAAWSASVEARSGAKVLFDLDVASLGGDDAAHRNVTRQVRRLEEAFARIARDDLGRKALTKVKLVRLRSSAAEKPARAIFADGTLTLEAPYAASRGVATTDLVRQLSQSL